MQDDTAGARAAAQQAVAQLRTEWAAVLNASIAPLTPVPIAPVDYDRNNIYRVCQFNDLPALRALIAQGVDVHEFDELAFQVAAQYGRIEIMQIFIGMGADIHADDDAALRWSGTVETVEFLAALGAPLEKLDAEMRQNYDGYKQAQNAACKQAIQAQQSLKDIFKAATWVGHVPEMRALWEQVPAPLQTELDFQHVLAETQVQTLKQRKTKVTIIK
jgi:hypothetical protein